MIRRREPTRIAATVHGVVAAIAYQSPDSSSRLRQLHEIDPGQFHVTAGVTPDECRYCTDDPP